MLVKRLEQVRQMMFDTYSFSRSEKRSLPAELTLFQPPDTAEQAMSSAEAYPLVLIFSV